MKAVFTKLFVGATLFGGMALAQSVEPPISTNERLRWLAYENVSPGAILVEIATGGVETAKNSPREYGPHWAGFGKRVGLTTANFAVKTTMEDGLGAIWGEDPRYNRTEGQSFPNRLGHVFQMTFMARNRQGNLMPAYARAAAFTGSSFLSNTWVPDSESSAHDAVVRVGLSYVGRLAANAFQEFRHRH